MIIEAEWLLLLATVAFVAGFVDTLAGGGGLITIPAFLLVSDTCSSVSHQQMSGLRWYFNRRVETHDFRSHQDRVAMALALLAFVMALIGAWSLRAVSDADWLDRIVPILLFAAALYFGFVRLPQTAMDHPPSFGVLAMMGIAFIVL